MKYFEKIYLKVIKNQFLIVILKNFQENYEINVEVFINCLKLLNKILNVIVYNKIFY